MSVDFKRMREAMYAVEFQTNIQDGTIEVPKEYRDKVKGSVRVIILTEEYRVEENFIEYLMHNPIQAPGFVPMKREDIYER